MLGFFRPFLSFLLTIALCLPQLISAQNTGLSFDHLGLANGLSQSSVNCILQDNAGFLWVGTQDGLNRYDGVSFKVFKHNRKDSTSIHDNFIHTLWQDPMGRIWIGTNSGIDIFNPRDEKFYALRFPDSGKDVSPPSVSDFLLWTKSLVFCATDRGLFQVNLDSLEKINPRILRSVVKYLDIPEVGNSIQMIQSAGNSSLWMATTDKGLQLYKPSSNKLLPLPDFLSPRFSDLPIKSILAENNGVLWIGTDEGLFLAEIPKNSLKHFTTQPGNSRSLSGNGIRKIFRDQRGKLWIGTLSGLNLYRPQTGSFSRILSSPFNDRSIAGNKVYSFLEDYAGTLWIGTEAGLNKFDRIQNNFNLLLQKNDLPSPLLSNNVWSMLELENGNLIVGTDDGLNWIKRENQSYEFFSVPFQPSSVYAICKDKAGEIWLGTSRGLCKFNSNSQKIIPFNASKELLLFLENTVVQSIWEDERQRLWIGTKNGLVILDVDRKFHQRVTGPGSTGVLPHPSVRQVFADASKTIWMASGGGLVELLNYKNGELKIPDTLLFRTYKHQPGNEKSLSNDHILSIAQIKSGELWIGTYGGGLNRFDQNSGKFDSYLEDNGLSNNVVYGILPGKEDALWLSTNFGLSKFSISSGVFRNYYQNNGLQSNEFNVGAWFRSSTGELFFGGMNGINAFDPANIIVNNTAPKICFTALSVFNKELKPGTDQPLQKSIQFADTVVLSYKQNYFTLDFAALHFSSPMNNRYQYILEGFDEEWTEVRGKGQAVFTGLPAGEYVFKVKASNSDGVWNKQEETLVIIITPPFWQTLGFRIIALILFVSLLFYYYKKRINRVVSQKRILERQIRERTSKIMLQKEEIEKQKELIEEEQKKSESLLRNMLPMEMAEELKNKGKASARSYSMASVMFTDFKGFTKIAQKLRPKELVEKLDICFGKFDEIIEKYNIEKIKTIGDSYMCAGGIPIRNKSNPIDIVLAGLEIQHFVREFQKQNADPDIIWELRIGINTGELIAGVIGKKRLAYDIWGDTVNIAARLEAYGEIGKVNISQSTYEFVKEFFVCKRRGKIEVKYKAEIDMYFVERIKPELSADEDGMIPNDLFQERLSTLLSERFNFRKSEQRILKLLTDNLPEGLYYHGIHHTLDVTQAAERIARHEGVDGEELFLLKTAALFHDAGFIHEYNKNEHLGVTMAKEILPNYGYTDKQLKIIEGLILATEIPQTPHNLLEMIMCDADLDYLGRDDFYEISDSLKNELIKFGKISGDRQWDQMQISFLEKHQYFTKSSIEVRQPEKLKRIEEIKARLIENRYDN
jgi:ligand-binding sensor domain-containing protein/class 3 adenylate cyclase/predicted metal-dependent HD superfamily phosphohydrolase